jgi:hypothetical protein
VAWPAGHTFGLIGGGSRTSEEADLEIGGTGDWEVSNLAARLGMRWRGIYGTGALATVLSAPILAHIKASLGTLEFEHFGVFDKQGQLIDIEVSKWYDSP